MTKFELRYGTRTIVTEVDDISLEDFVALLGSTGWWLIEDEDISIQVSQIDSVKEIK
jgi:hypothetical protein